MLQTKPTYGFGVAARNVYRMLFAVAGSKVNILRIRSTRQKRLIDSIDDE